MGTGHSVDFIPVNLAKAFYSIYITQQTII